MPELQRISDKYSGIRICDLKPDELEEFLGSICKRASIDTLKSVGLGDDFAIADIRDLRDILKGFRVIRRGVITTTLSTFGRVIGWVCVLFLAGFFLHTSPTIKKTVVDLMAP